MTATLTPGTAVILPASLNKKPALRLRVLHSYYLATPLFVAIDLLWKVNVRVAFLNSLPLLKYSYYAFAFFCGLYIYRNPQKTNIVSLFEASVNLIFLIVGFVTAYYNAVFGVLEMRSMQAVVDSFNIWMVVNFALSAGVLSFCLHSNPFFKQDSRTFIDSIRCHGLARG